METVLLRIRAALGRLGRQWPAFDIALSVYWERQHPGESLVGYLRRSSSANAAARWASDQIANTLDQFLGGFGVVGAGLQLAGMAGRAASRAVTLRRLRADYPPFDLLIDERDPDRMLGYLPALFAYDLEQIRAEKPALAVCVLDTFEHIQLLPHERGGLEDLICRAVYLMPNVYFLVASRRPLLWHDPIRSVGLVYGGDLRWPRLSGVTEPSDQFTLDGFDDASAEQYLMQRLTQDGHPLIPPEIREVMIESSGGSPHYLELSAGLFEQMLARGEPVPAEAFGRPFPELVLRLMRDMTEADRDLLRTAALLEAFDEDILMSVLPDARGRRVEEFLRRRFIRHDPDVWPAYRLHESVRGAVLDCDEHTADGWTTSERHRYVLRATSYLANLALSLWESDRSSTTSLHELSRRSVAAFLLSFYAARRHGVLPPELDQMAYTLHELGHWQAMGTLPELDDHADPDLRRLADICRTDARIDLDAPRRFEAMVAAAGDTESGHYRDYVRYTLGNVAYFIGRLAESDRYFDAVAESPTVLGSGARYGMAGNALRESRFDEAVRLLGRQGDSPIEQIRGSNMLGHVQLHNGRFNHAAELFTSALERARRVNAPLWQARASRHLALACMWLDPDRTLRVVPEARELNQSLGELVGLAQCDMAAATAHALRREFEQANTLLAQAKEGFQSVGAGFELLPVEIIDVLLHLAQDRTEEALAGARRLCDASAQGQPIGPRTWAAIAALWLDQRSWLPFESIGWLDADDARARWLDPLRRLRYAERAGD
jgi:hypothetical protein